LPIALGKEMYKRQVVGGIQNPKKKQYDDDASN